MVSSTIIDILLQDSLKDASATLAYYYFDFSEAESRTLDAFVRSLIIQLTANLSETPHCLSSLYTHSRITKQEPSTESLMEVLRTIVMESARTIVAVDALDECCKPEELIQFIGEMRSWKVADLRLLVVSRQHFEGADVLQDLQPVHISIQDEVTNNDILRFVEEVLSKDTKLKYWPPKVKHEIETALVSKSNGMFRWVACQTDFLKKCRTQEDIDKVLRTLPRTLEETYDRILVSISEAWKSDVRAVLQWLAFSERPMRLEEVAEIVAFDTPHTGFDINRRLLNPLEILTLCSSLLVANETYYYDFHVGYNKIPVTELRLAHFTVKDYLLSPGLHQSCHSYYSMERKSSNLQISKACLTYLNLDEFSSGYHGKIVQDALLESWPLLDYAARFCGLHLRIGEDSLDLSARNLLQKLLATHILPNGGNFGTLVGTVWSGAGQHSIQSTKPLYFAASYGVVYLVRLLLTDATAVDIEAKGGRVGSSPLQVASYRGNTECVRLLLEAGADPNSTNVLNETSLYWASRLRFVEIVELLRSFGAKR